MRNKLRLRLRKNHHHDHHITVTDQSPTNSNNSTTPQQSAAVFAQVQDKGRHHSRPTGMPTNWCHSDKLNLGRCDSFRRKGWGVCRACWVDKIQGNKELEEAYRSWWTEEKRTHLNASDEKVWAPSSLVLTPAAIAAAWTPPAALLHRRRRHQQARQCATTCMTRSHQRRSKGSRRRRCSRSSSAHNK